MRISEIRTPVAERLSAKTSDENSAARETRAPPTSGMTLDQLKITTKLIGAALEAGVAIPAHMKYEKKAKSGEAPKNIRELFDASASSYDEDFAARGISTAVKSQFPDAGQKTNDPRSAPSLRSEAPREISPSEIARQQLLMASLDRPLPRTDDTQASTDIRRTSEESNASSDDEKLFKSAPLE